MKKIFLIFILFVLFTFVNNNFLSNKIVPTNTKDYLDYTDFIDVIKVIKSYKIENTTKYYQEYLNQEFKNYIHLLNKVNYPDFLNINSNKTYSYIKEPIPLVNKKFILNKEYIPNDLTYVSIDYIERDYEVLVNKNANYALADFMNYYQLDFTVFSAYRSFYKQDELFNNSTDNLVAEPGKSEHQTGLAVDISKREIGLTFELEKDLHYSLLYSKLYQYGFILRYPKDKEHITGFVFEPWHFRYVGTKISKIIYEQNITLEEYFYYYIPLVY